DKVHDGVVAVIQFPSVFYMRRPPEADTSFSTLGYLDQNYWVSLDVNGNLRGVKRNCINANSIGPSTPPSSEVKYIPGEGYYRIILSLQLITYIAPNGDNLHSHRAYLARYDDNFNHI